MLRRQPALPAARSKDEGPPLPGRAAATSTTAPASDCRDGSAAGCVTAGAGCVTADGAGASLTASSGSSLWASPFSLLLALMSRLHKQGARPARVARVSKMPGSLAAPQASSWQSRVQGGDAQRVDGTLRAHAPASERTSGVRGGPADARARCPVVGQRQAAQGPVSPTTGMGGASSRKKRSLTLAIHESATQMGSPGSRCGGSWARSRGGTCARESPRAKPSCQSPATGGRGDAAGWVMASGNNQLSVQAFCFAPEHVFHGGHAQPVCCCSQSSCHRRGPLLSPPLLIQT